MHVEQHRRPSVRGQVGASPDVEPVALAELGVGDVAGRPVPASLAEPGQRLLGDGQPGLTTERFRHVVAVPGTECRGECVVQHRRCSPRIDGEAGQTRPRGQFDRQRDPTRPCRQRAGAGGERGARRLCGEREQRCLTRRPSRSERGDASSPPPGERTVRVHRRGSADGARGQQPPIGSHRPILASREAPERDQRVAAQAFSGCWRCAVAWQ